MLIGTSRSSNETQRLRERRSLGFSRRVREAVPDPVLGTDVALRGVHLAAEVRDVRSQHLGLMHVRWAPYLAQQRVVCEETPAMAKQSPQKPDFDRCEVYLRAGAMQRVRRKVDLQAIELHAGLHGVFSRPSQDGAQSGHEFARRERLHDAVVGARL